MDMCKSTLSEYQLYKQGFPVVSTVTTTSITTTWGENQIFRYKTTLLFTGFNINSEKFKENYLQVLRLLNSLRRESNLS